MKINPNDPKLFLFKTIPFTKTSVWAYVAIAGFFGYGIYDHLMHEDEIEYPQKTAMQIKQEQQIERIRKRNEKYQNSKNDSESE